MSECLVDRLERLSRRIVAGDVVFFVGAGFSLDSEHNDAGVLIARLLARFDAVVASAATLAADHGLRVTSEALKTTLQETFSLASTPPDGIWGSALLDNVWRLSQNYYLINDWMCSAFEAMLDYAPQLDALASEIHARELELFAGFVAAREAQAVNRAGGARAAAGYRAPALQPPIFGRLGQLREAEARDPRASMRASAGKAMFLETMGFADPAVMAGDPHADSLETVSASYSERLRPRHAVLAWLALEGVLPVVVTTNYDLLIEGAYRLSGLQPLLNPSSAPAAPDRRQASWNRRLQNYTPIADATQFFSHGDGHQSALILKIHGCARFYREEREDLERWRRVLPTMVFTFREIQNWRDDSWSRDYLQSLLRTRTVVFAGYSTTDAVIHDTFRSVYEEMTRYRTLRTDALPTEPSSATPPAAARAADPDAPVATPHGGSANAFVLNVTGKREFHALEILRAASLAAGQRSPELTGHPNLLNFALTPDDGYPTLDEMSSWLFHTAYRQLQRQAVAGELRRVAYQLFGNPVPESDATIIEANFTRLIKAECAHARTLETDWRAAPAADTLQAVQAQRVGHRQIVGWSVDFHRNLMREYAAADLLVRKPERAGQMHNVLRWPYYAPINEHPEWAVWGVVLELAIRRRAALWANCADRWLEPGPWALPAPSDRPVVRIPKYRVDAKRPAQTSSVAPTIALTIEVGELRQMIDARAGNGPLTLLPRVVWMLRKHAVPWWQPEHQRRELGTDGAKVTPDAEAIWQWAIGKEDGDEVTIPRKKGASAKASEVHAFFRGSSGSGTRHDAA